jgi:hypothetical protein
MRTPEQIKAAREAARTATGRGTGSSAHYSSPSVQNRGPSTASTAKGDS